MSIFMDSNLLAMELMAAKCRRAEFRAKQLMATGVKEQIAWELAFQEQVKNNPTTTEA